MACRERNAGCQGSAGETGEEFIEQLLGGADGVAGWGPAFPGFVLRAAGAGVVEVAGGGGGGEAGRSEEVHGPGHVTGRSDDDDLFSLAPLAGGEADFIGGAAGVGDQTYPLRIKSQEPDQVVEKRLLGGGVGFFVGDGYEQAAIGMTTLEADAFDQAGKEGAADPAVGGEFRIRIEAGSEDDGEGGAVGGQRSGIQQGRVFGFLIPVGVERQDGQAAEEQENGACSDEDEAGLPAAELPKEPAGELKQEAEDDRRNRPSGDGFDGFHGGGDGGPRTEVKRPVGGRGLDSSTCFRACDRFCDSYPCVPGVENRRGSHSSWRNPENYRIRDFRHRSRSVC